MLTAEVDKVLNTAGVDALNIVRFGEMLNERGAVDDGVDLLSVELIKPVFVGDTALNDRYSVFKVRFKIVLEVVVELTSQALFGARALGAPKQAVNVSAVVIEEKL